MIQKENIIGGGGIVAKTEQVYLRPISVDDKDSFLWVASHCKYYVPGISKEDFDNCFYTADNDDTITLCIIENGTDKFAGFCQLLNINSDEPEITLELVRDFRGRDIEYEVFTTVINIVFSKSTQQSILYRTTRSNYYKRELAERMGAYLIQENYTRNLYRLFGVRSNMATSTLCEMDIFTYELRKNDNRKEGKITDISVVPWFDEIADVIRKRAFEYTSELAESIEIDELKNMCIDSRDNMELFKPLYKVLYKRDPQAAFEVFNKIMEE